MITSRSLAQIATPSLASNHRTAVSTATQVPEDVTVVGVLVAEGGATDTVLDAAALSSAGFTGAEGTVQPLSTGGGPLVVAVGVGAGPLTAAVLRDAASAFAAAVPTHERLALRLDQPAASGLDGAVAAQAAVEGVLLTRYSYDSLKTSPSTVPMQALTVVAADVGTAGEGVRRGEVYAAATALNRDLANTPHSHLNASDFAEIAQALGADHGFDVEVLEKEQIRDLGCGGLLGVNAGSFQPPRLVKLRYRAGQAASRVALVGKGIMFDSGGLSLKPSDATHAQMKNDMSGAAAILAAFVATAQLGTPVNVDGWLMCTDNMPSSTAQVLGDVLTTRDGTTVEVIDTDAEGRLVLADGLGLATEEPVDAVVTIATLTGSVMRALGTEIAGVFGTSQPLVEQVKAAAAAVDEPVWQLPLHRGYRKLIDSRVADIMNVAPLGNPDGIIAALFLSHFVRDVPFAHLDIAGVAQSDNRRTWHGEGCTGFGARLLIELLARFSAPAR